MPWGYDMAIFRLQAYKSFQPTAICVSRHFSNLKFALRGSCLRSTQQMTPAQAQNHCNGAIMFCRGDSR